MVVAGGLILMIGAIILSMRSFSSLTGSIRQGQRTQAEEIAESGANIIIEELNQNYPYLLVVNCNVTNNSASEQMQPPECDGGWDAYDLDDMNPVGVCSQRSEEPQDIMETLYQPSPEGKGFFRLRSYEFFGDQIQGGTAVIKVQGQLRHGSPDNPKIISSAILKKEITIIPKCCDSAPFETCHISSDWKYGLAAKTMNLRTGDILDEDPNINVSSANVHCQECLTSPPFDDLCEPWDDVSFNQIFGNGTESENSIVQSCQAGEDISERNSGFVAGARTNGNIDIPEAPTWDIDKWGDPTPITIGFDAYTNEYNSPEFTHASVEGEHPTIKGCYTDIVNNKKITHCRIQTINFVGEQKVRINPGEGDIRFYIEGIKVDFSGNHFIIPNNAKFGQFAIFGGASTWEDAYRKNKAYGPGQKSFDFAGNGKINAFLYMPYFKISLAGGQCYSEDAKLILRGVAIAHRWETNGDCAQIKVPTEAGSTLCKDYNLCTNSTANESEDMEYMAVGTNRWDFVQMDR